MDTEFRHLDMTTKIKLLYALCEYRLDAEDAAEQTKVWLFSCIMRPIAHNS